MHYRHIDIRRFIAAALAVLVLTGCASSTAGEMSARESTEATAAEESVPGETGSGETVQESAGSKETAEAESGTEGHKDGESDAQDPAESNVAESDIAESDIVESEEKVTVVIPTVYEDVKTQEEADAIRDKNGYESATLEEDGSLSIVMSKSQYDEMIRQFRLSVDKGISEIISADNNSVIEKIEYNDDYSVFTVTVSGEEIGIIERQAADELVMYGTLYHIYTGNDTDHIHVDYVNRETGEVIESADSGNLDSAY